MRALAAKTTKSKKQERQYQVLLGLVDAYLKTGKPVGSDALKNQGFDDLSSATIRNYFAALDDEGYLEQLHTSGGRTPTAKALRLYAAEYKETTTLSQEDRDAFWPLFEMDSKEISTFLQKGMELLSRVANLPVFLSAPRFDHDFVVSLKLVMLDHSRLVSILLTEFGKVETEVLFVDEKLSSFSLKRIEEHLNARLSHSNTPLNLDPEEKILADRIQSEVMVRYIVGYAHFSKEELYRTGLSELLDYPELHDPKMLSSTLSLFENSQKLHKLVRESLAKKELSFWIGDDLNPLSEEALNCQVMIAPYKIHQQFVGTVGFLGPMRVDYKRNFALLAHFVDHLSQILTKTIYKYKIQYRQPKAQGPLMLESDPLMMLEHHKEKG